MYLDKTKVVCFSPATMERFVEWRCDEGLKMLRFEERK